MIKSTLKYCLLTLCAAATVGCIKEDMSECDSSIRLRFSYTLHDEQGQGNLFGRDIHHVRAYVFNTEGVLETIAAAHGTLGNDYAMNLSLKPGAYRVVTWASESEEFFRSYLQSQSLGAELIAHQSTIDELRVTLACEPTPDADGNRPPLQAQFDDLFYGAAGTRSTDGQSLYTIIPIELKAGKTEEHTVELIRNTNIIRLTVKGAWNVDPATGLETSLTGANTRYTYQNTITGDAPRVCFQPRFGQGDASTLRADINVQRLEWTRTASEPLVLSLKDRNSGQSLLQQDLVELLKKAKDNNNTPLYRNQEDFDREYIYPITLDFADDMTLKIYVKDWLIQTIKPEL